MGDMTKALTPETIAQGMIPGLLAAGARIGNSVLGDQPGDEGFIHITDAAGIEYTIRIESR